MHRTPIAVAVLSLLLPALTAQAAGLRGGAQELPQVQRLAPPEPAAAERVITIEAVAEVRVVPSSLRVVFACSAGGTTAIEAMQRGRAQLADARAKLVAAGLAEGDLDTDFIAMLPVYTWTMEKPTDHDVIAEHRTGMRVQHNLHVKVADEAGALHAIEAAQAVDGVDVLAVDYWSEQLEDKQVEAQAKALAAARRKATLLLSAFPKPPKPINVYESTKLLFPQQLYLTLPNAEDSAGGYFGRDVPRIPATRPQHVYYRGLFGDVDAVEKEMPGKREIHVVSTVRLYFAAPERAPIGEGKGEGK